MLLCASHCIDKRAMDGVTTEKGLPVFAEMITMLLVGCSTPMVKDSPPSGTIDVSKIPNAVPQPHYDVLKRSSYQLGGISYQPMATAVGFRQEGTASWYGTKFHGRKTANGETYNLYAMTAAHKTLPLPSYVRVTNKANGRSVVLRVNDRGPFHGDRIIDLSYVAAQKLGFHNKGTASVVVEGIDTFAMVLQDAQAPAAGRRQTTKVPPVLIYVQVAALSNRADALALQKRLQSLVEQSVFVMPQAKENNKLYRVRVGPLVKRSDAIKLGDLLVNASFERGHLVFE